MRQPKLRKTISESKITHINLKLYSNKRATSVDERARELFCEHAKLACISSSRISLLPQTKIDNPYTNVLVNKWARHCGVDKRAKASFRMSLAKQQCRAVKFIANRRFASVIENASIYRHVPKGRIELLNFLNTNNIGGLIV